MLSREERVIRRVEREVKGRASTRGVVTGSPSNATSVGRNHIYGVLVPWLRRERVQLITQLCHPDQLSVFTLPVPHQTVGHHQVKVTLKFGVVRANLR